MSSYPCRIPTAACLLFALVGVTGCQPPVSKPPAPTPPEVLYATPVLQTVTEFEEFTGRTWAVDTVEIRSRVSGYLEEVKFDDGALIEKGELLFVVDDRSFEAQVDRADAAVAQYKARIARLKRQEQRAQNLVQTQAITEEAFDAIVADRHEAEASLAAAVADQEIARLNLSYTKVTSPIAGRISRRLVDPGNLVTADTTVLATIITVDPIYVYFDMDERTVLRLRRLLQDGLIKSVRDSAVEVQIALSDESDFTHRGTVDFVDNQVDPSTGTLRFRAEVRNKNLFFSPGLFVRVRFPIGEPRPAVMVPEEALATDQGQRFLYVIGEDDKVEYRRVKTGLLVDGKRVIHEGVEPTERVIVTGLQRIRPGMQVAPRDASEAESLATQKGPEKPPVNAAAKSGSTSH